jgi:hypothetical protein
MRDKQKLVVFRDIQQRGSIKDLIYRVSTVHFTHLLIPYVQCDPFKKPYIEKYGREGNPVVGKPLSEAEIKRYGSQILQVCICFISY